MKLTQEEYLRRFRAIIEEMYKLTANKNHDYATEDDALANFNEFGAAGVLVRIGDKFKRIKNALWLKREFRVAENLTDTLIDMAVYAVIMYIIVTWEREQFVADKESSANNLSWSKQLKRGMK